MRITRGDLPICEARREKKEKGLAELATSRGGEGDADKEGREAQISRWK
jgi:hypothetical protein